MAPYVTIPEVRQEIRIIVDPLLIRLRQDLYGSGVSFGRISSDALPTTTIYTTNITQVLTSAGYFTDPMTTNGDMIARIAGVTTRLPIGTTGQVLAVSGGRPVWSTISSSGIGGGMSNPMTTAGDIIYALTGGTPTRLGIGTTGQALIVVSGYPAWQNIPAGFTNPMTTAGDLIYGTTAGAALRLAVGTSGQVLTAIGGLPVWRTIDTAGTTVTGIDISGTLPSGLRVTGIQGTAVASGTPVLGDRLRFNGTTWEASSKIWQPLTNGDATNPELIFAGGDIIMVDV